MEDLRGRGIDIWSAGVDDARGVVVIRLSELRDDWIAELRERFGDRLTFQQDGPITLAQTPPASSRRPTHQRGADVTGAG